MSKTMGRRTNGAPHPAPGAWYFCIRQAARTPLGVGFCRPTSIAGGTKESDSLLLTTCVLRHFQVLWFVKVVFGQQRNRATGSSGFSQYSLEIISKHGA